MSNFTIRNGSYCPVCKGITLRDCSHSMEQLQQVVSGISPASRLDRLIRDNERLLLKANSLGDDLREAESELAEARRLLRLTYGCIGTLRRMAESPAREQYDELQRYIAAFLAATAKENER